MLSDEGLTELGFFGGMHRDTGDSAASYTSMFANSDLPDDYEGGRFHLVELGIYVELEGLVCVCFSGLRLHGGTPPRAPKKATTIPKEAYRWVMVLYPQGSVLDGGSNVNVAALPDRTPFQIVPEMKDSGSVQSLALFLNTISNAHSTQTFCA